MKSLKQTLPNYIAACFAGLWIESFEPDEAIRELKVLCKEQAWDFDVWDIEKGFSDAEEKHAGNPLGAVQAAAKFGYDETPQLVVLRHFHRFLGSIEVVQAVERAIQCGKSSRTFLIVLAPVAQIPVELEKAFTVIEHPLPDRAALLQIASELTNEPLPDDVITRRVLDAAAGMTRMEAEGAFSMSVIEHGRIVPESIWTLKSNMLRQSSALRLYRGEIPTLGGLDHLGRFCEKALAGTSTERALGVMLVGVSGSGKSAFCKRLGHLVRRPTLVLDTGSLMGSLVGQTEAALRKALKQIDAMSPCIVMIDEIEKAISTDGNDGGVSARMFGTLLTWLNDRESDSFVVCTANDISKLPPEFTRAERFDGIFFVDLPNAEARKQIWDIYLRQYELPKQKPFDGDDDWTGAEIKACCRLAKLLDMPLAEAADNVVPVAKTAAESIERLRNWATGRCLDAARPGIYGSDRTASAAPRRNLGRDGKSAGKASRNMLG